MKYDSPLFSKHTYPPFAWTSSDWPRSKKWQPVMVSIELAEDVGWRVGRDIVLGQHRIRITQFDWPNDSLIGYRDSGPAEETIRGAIYLVKELVISALRYYFGPKPTWQ